MPQHSLGGIVGICTSHHGLVLLPITPHVMPSRLQKTIPSWKRDAKQRLRNIAERQGWSQREFAERWLGDASRSSQINLWLAPHRSDFPGVENLLELRDRCGVGLDYVLGQRPSSDGPWPTERIEDLAVAFENYSFFAALNIANFLTSRPNSSPTYDEDAFGPGGYLSAEMLGLRRGKYALVRHKHINAGLVAMDEGQGGFLQLLTRKIRDSVVAQLERWERAQALVDAKKWRKLQRTQSATATA